MRCWRPTKQVFDLGDVGDAAAHILEARFIGLIVGNEHDLGIAASTRSHAFSKLVNRDLFIRPNIKQFAYRVLRLSKSHYSLVPLLDISKSTVVLSRRLC